MGDPLSVIAVAGLTYRSAKTLNEAIASFANAPELLRDLSRDLGILQDVLQALKEESDGVPNTDLSNDHKACFEGLKPALGACKEVCDRSALQSMSVANVTIRQEDVQNVASVLREHGRVLKLCLESCTSGLKDTTARAGTQVRYARIFNEARQAIGSMGNVTGGGPATVVECAEARDQSVQHVGAMDTESAEAFWTSK